MAKRSGQQSFRRKAINISEQCEATLSNLMFAIDACHIKPYSLCTDDEKSDPNNSILFLASIHRAFDHGYITFNDDGKIVISKKLDQWEWESLGLSGKERIRMPGNRKEYMHYHRNNIFKDKI